MGALGMIASGCGFLCIGVWQLWDVLTYSRAQRCFKTPAFHAVQLLFMAALAFLHMISGFVASHRAANMADGVGMAVPLERSGVALAFLIFAISALISEKTTLLPLPSEILQLFLMFAFGEEFLLFYLQRTDAGLEGRYYDLLLVPIVVCLFSTALGVAYPSAVMPPLARSAAIILQGTWLFQMALSFFTNTFTSKGCSLRQRGDGDYVISCEGTALMRGKAVATIQFNCHMALLLIILLPFYGIYARRNDMLAAHKNLNYERLEDTDSYRDGVESGAAPTSCFSIELEESDTTPDKHHNPNGVAF